MLDKINKQKKHSVEKGMLPHWFSDESQRFVKA